MSMKNVLLSASIAAMTLSVADPANAGTLDYLGDIIEVGFTFCPRNTTDANGQLLPISQNQALFSLYGTIYGGDGRTTFAVPDLRGRTSLHTGQGPGLTNVNQGARGGAESFTLTTAQMPSHTHQAGIKTVAEAANTMSPAGAAFTVLSVNAYHTGTNPGPVGNRPRFMNPETMYMTPTGGGQAVNHRSPYLTTRKCAVTAGTYPSRN